MAGHVQRSNDVGAEDPLIMMLLSWQIFHWVTTLKVLVYVEKINDGGVVFSKGDVVALDDGDEVVGVEVVVSEFDSSDTESNESGSESGFDNDNEGVVFEDSEEEREIRVNDGFDSEDECLVNLVSKKKCRKASCVGSSGSHRNVEEGNGDCVWWRLVTIIFLSFEISNFLGESWRIYTCISNVRHTIWIASHGSKLYCCLEVEKKKIEDYLPEIFTLFKMTNKTDCLIILFYLSSWMSRDGCTRLLVPFLRSMFSSYQFMLFLFPLRCFLVFFFFCWLFIIFYIFMEIPKLLRPLSSSIMALASLFFFLLMMASMSTCGASFKVCSITNFIAFRMVLVNFCYLA